MRAVKGEGSPVMKVEWGAAWNQLFPAPGLWE
jgi:hypothetical protein